MSEVARREYVSIMGSPPRPLSILGVVVTIGLSLLGLFGMMERPVSCRCMDSVNLGHWGSGLESDQWVCRAACEKHGGGQPIPRDRDAALR